MGNLMTVTPTSNLTSVSNPVTEAAAALDKIYGFTGQVHVGQASGKISHMFESAKAMEMPIGLGTLATLGTAIVSTSPTVTAAMGLGFFINGMFSGSKKDNPPTR